MHHDVDVVIAGAGPVGCVAAGLLADAGLSVHLVEGAYELPRQLRASTFHPATLEMLDRLGVVERLVERGLIADHFQYRERNVGIVADFDLGVIADMTPHPYRLQAEQFKLCEIIIEDLSTVDHAAVSFGTRLTDVVGRDDGVDITIQNADGTVETIAASWLIGADGASSTVRHSLGLPFDGMTYEDRYLVASTPIDLREAMPDLAYVNYVADQEEWLVLLRTPDVWRVLFPVKDDTTDDEYLLSDEHIEQRMQGVSARDEPYPLAHRTIYRVHQRVAPTFKEGRILLAGDAAHVNNPLGGMGMNGGIHDAVLFADGIAAFEAGDIEDGDLVVAADVRRDLAIEYVKRHTHSNAVTLGSPDPQVRRAALDMMRDRAADLDATRQYIREASMIEAVAQMREQVSFWG